MELVATCTSVPPDTKSVKKDRKRMQLAQTALLRAQAQAQAQAQQAGRSQSLQPSGPRAGEPSASQSEAEAVAGETETEAEAEAESNPDAQERKVQLGATGKSIAALDATVAVPGEETMQTLWEKCLGT